MPSRGSLRRLPVLRDGNARLLVGCGLVLATVWALALVRFRHWNANDDLAILQLHLERIGSGDIPLVGAYSRLDFHHPGPLREWLFGAAYWASGRRSAALPATALALNLAWTMAACAAGWRIARRTGVIAAALGALLLHLGLGWNLHAAWNPYLGVLAAYAAVWGVVLVIVRGGAGWPLPVVAASFAAHQHVSALPLGLLALAVVAVIVARERGGATNPVWPAAATVALWSGPLLDLTRGGDSNVVRLLRNGGEGEAAGFAEAGRHVGRLVLPWSIAGGDSLRATGLETASTAVVVAVAIVAALVIGLIAVPQAPLGRVAIGIALAVVVVVWVTVAVGFAPPLFPYLFAPSVGALASVSALVLLALAPNAVSRAPVRPRTGSTVGVVTVACVALAWAAGGWRQMQPIATAPLQQQIDAAVRAAVVPGQPYTIDAGGLVESVAHGEVALAVQQAGGEPRSDIFSLGLPAAITSDPVFAVAMGAPLACLLAEPGPPPIVLAASTASGLDVGVFLADGGTELERALFCLAQ